MPFNQILVSRPRRFFVFSIFISVIVLSLFLLDEANKEKEFNDERAENLEDLEKQIFPAQISLN